MIQLKRILIFSLYLSIIHAHGNNSTCGCYLQGTLSTIEGDSMCDNETLQCSCYPNVIGRNCNKCAVGFYDILSGMGCTSCRCSTSGSNSKACNILTGQCSCKAKFTGLQCNHCAPNMYQSSSTKCSACNCDIHGSKDFQCNVVGQCPCLPNIEGKKCNQCIENTYNIKKGCIPCPPCYEFFQRETKNFTRYLEKTEEIVKQVEDALPLHIQEYKHFLNEIKVLRAKINKLKLKYDESMKSDFSEEVLQNLSKQAEDLHQEILNWIKTINSEFSFKKIEDSQYAESQSLKEANNLVATCEEASKNATDLSKALNRHNNTMTKLAKQAIAKSNEAENKAEEFYQLSLNTSLACNETCSTIEEFKKEQENHRQEIENTKMQVLNTSGGVQAVKKYVTEFHKQVRSSKEESLKLQDETSKLDVPTLDKATLETWNKIEADRQNIENMIKDFEKETEQEEKQQDVLEEHFRTTQNNQKKVDDKYLLTQEYDNRADQAIKASTTILNKAQDALNLFKYYEKIKHSAEEALKEMPVIRNVTKTILTNSKEINNIFEELYDIVKEIEEAKLKIDETMKLIDGNATQVSNNLKAVERLEQQQIQIIAELQKYQKSINSIKGDLQHMEKEQEEVELSIKRLEEYIYFIDALPLTKMTLFEIEKDIIELENMRIKEILESIQHLTDIKNQLQKEVEHVKVILEEMPINGNLCETAKSEPKALPDF